MCPGLYLEEAHTIPSTTTPTGVPVFLGYVRRPAGLCSVEHWSQFSDRFGAPAEHGYLATAVRGFFENGGKLCYVAPLDSKLEPINAIRSALRTSIAAEDADLLCAPDLWIDRSGKPVPLELGVQLQAALLHPSPTNEGRADRFAILDSFPGADPMGERTHCDALLNAVDAGGGGPADLSGAALYYPWVVISRVPGGRDRTGAGSRVDTTLAPPCGHIAGIYGRTDAAHGIRKAPANEVINGVLDLATVVTEEDQAAFFASSVPPGAVNCLRAFAGRGIRVWGARTLSRDENWRFVNVRRIFLQSMRWIERKMAIMAFEPNGPDLWARIRRELNAYCYDLYQKGSLKGAAINNAFFVRCDAETNPPEIRDSGTIVAEVGLAAAQPNEFIVVRLIHRSGGTTVSGEGAASI